MQLKFCTFVNDFIAVVSIQKNDFTEYN